MPKQAYLRYSVVYGDQEHPPKESEPTLEQLSAVHHLINQNHSPYCDFAIWGPYVHRLVKKLKFSGYVIGQDGVLTSVEVPLVASPSSTEPMTMALLDTQPRHFQV